MAMNEMLAPRLLHLDVIRFIPFKEFTDRLPQAYLKLAVQLTQMLDLTGHTKEAAELPMVEIHNSPRITLLKARTTNAFASVFWPSLRAEFMNMLSASAS